ncbi:protein of unknown function [Shewanella benthica]|uniref:Uncharacterized protein n=1 Tax=Shewanella benthica TaxID=43661 RepID=A0A330LZJ0_9GAMM|nr:protein of unknown function [Shewanella benthica]
MFSSWLKHCYLELKIGFREAINAVLTECQLKFAKRISSNG